MFICLPYVVGGFGQGLLVLRLMHLKYLGEGLIVSSLIGVVWMVWSGLYGYDKKLDTISMH